ncbi:DNA-deoxyinosine glycosylase [Lacrimispora sp. 210928-DFI.3.58]|uniref:DNA-deoxyinosine glycosylase n=1 Tax=Lacrimispora sp. 210928-DFI.3.58 TaxID=2883214 RepID=UPI0029CA6C01|nr:DNA-deoxyinosine glycosylase [Lacrimispora sp. 210928-DFI.3.58]
MPFISLIIPVYNAEKYLRRCFNSVLGQTFQDMEVIVINDGSTDGSLSICREYEEKDSRFVVIDKENTGVSDSRNQAIAVAKGCYLQFIDSDDWLTPDATELLAEAAGKYDCDLVVADFYRVERAVYTEKQHIRERGLLTREQYAEYMMQDPADFYYGVLWNKLYRKSIIEEHQLKMEEELRFCEDFLFNLRFIRHAARFAAIQTPIYYYMKRKGSLVSTDWKKANAVALKLRLLKEYKELYQSMGLYEENELRINAFVLSFAKDGGVAAPMSRRRQKLDAEDYIDDQLPPGFVRVRHTFEPICDEHCRILILGSFPSLKSRENNFYYGHPQNRFWRLLARLLGTEVPETIEEKKSLLLRHGIALWDVVAECDIRGSSDLSIRNVIPANLNQVLRLADIQIIIANGATAHRLYEKYCEERTGRRAVKCPSTSPANAVFTLDRLAEAWGEVLGPYIVPDIDGHVPDKPKRL